MPKVSLREAILEKEDRAGDLCRSCSAPAEEGWEPYCTHCGSYWRDVEEGLFDDVEEVE